MKIEIKEQYKEFLEDMEKNLKDKEDLEYVKLKFSMFVDKVLEQMNSIVDYKEERMNELEQKQNEIEEKIDKMQQIVDNIEKDIYSEDGFDFEIVCPYCDNQFFIDMDENKTEVECPKCNNIIELDWSGDTEEDMQCSDDNCAHCNGCDVQPEEPKDEEKNNDDDM